MKCKRKGSHVQEPCSTNIKKAPLCKGGCRKATEGLLYYHFAGSSNRQYVYTIPPAASLRLAATPLCTRGAYEGSGSLRRATSFCWGEAWLRFDCRSPCAGGCMANFWGMSQSKHPHEKAPLCKGGCRKATEGLLYYHFAGSSNRQYVQTIPPTRLRRATSLYTRGAYEGNGSLRRATSFCWGRLMRLERAFHMPPPFVGKGFIFILF